MKVSIFKWLSLPVDPPISPPVGLADYQLGWFWNLFWASLQAKSMGYLPWSDNLWSIAGARRRDFFDAHKSAVLAGFEIVELDGIKLIYYPPLKTVIEENLKSSRQKRALSSELGHSESGQLIAMPPRPVSSRLRFEILKRDAFTCQYCSRRSPEVQLEVDHIIPLAEGGATEIDNLITACHPCNRGKAAIPLESRGKLSA